MSDLQALKSSLGQPAEGEKRFFPRTNITKKILRKLSNGENLLISAPRRIGKSSILKDIVKNQSDQEIIKYMIVQSVNSQEEFFKKLFNELIEDKEIFDGVSGYLTRISPVVNSCISRVNGIKGVTLKDTTPIERIYKIYTSIYECIFKQ